MGGNTWAKWAVRVLAAVYIMGGVVSLVAPEITGRFSRWFGTHPVLVRLDGVALIALGVLLGLREYREEGPPQPRWWRMFRW